MHPVQQMMMLRAQQQQAMMQDPRVRMQMEMQMMQDPRVHMMLQQRAAMREHQRAAMMEDPEAQMMQGPGLFIRPEVWDASCPSDETLGLGSLFDDDPRVRRRGPLRREQAGERPDPRERQQVGERPDLRERMRVGGRPHPDDGHDCGRPQGLFGSLPGPRNGPEGLFDGMRPDGGRRGLFGQPPDPRNGPQGFFGRLGLDRGDRRHGRGRAHGGSGIPVPGYELVKPLNTGGMSEAVNLVKHVRSGKLFVEKRVRVTGVLKKRATSELHALQRIERGRNLNFMAKFMWKEDMGFCSFILEYCDGGSLDSMMKDRLRMQKNFSEEFVWHTIVGIAKGLAFLHHGIRDPVKDGPDDTWNTICHLDLKPCNVFFSTVGQQGPHLRVVLGDFGCAITSSDIEFGMEHPRQQMCGTPEWYPPEGLADQVGAHRTRYGTETDVWQMGATIHSMCRLVTRPDRHLLESGHACGRAFGKRLNASVSWCCMAEWRKRPSAAKLVKEAIKTAKDKRVPQTSWA